MSIKKPSAVESIYVTTTDITPVKKPSAVNSAYVTTANTTDTTPVTKPSAVNAPQVITDTNPVINPSTVDSPYVTTDTTPTRLAAAPAAGGGISTVASTVSPTVSANANTDTAASSTGSNVSYYASGIEGIAGLANQGRVFEGANVYVTLEQPQYVTYNQIFEIGNSISVTGNITTSDGYFIGNGSQLTGVVATSSYGNANVVANLAALGSNPVSTTGNVTGGYFIGNGSQLTGLAATYGNSNVATFLAAYGSNTVVTTGNVTAGNVLASAEVVASGVIQTGTGFSTGGYLSVNGSTDLHDTNIIGTLSVNTIRSDDSTIVQIQDGVEVDGDAVVNGNVTGAYILGNGSQLTGLPAIYGNANVTALLSNLGSNVISGTGNITTTANISGAYVKGNGSELTSLPAPVVTQDITSNGAMSIMTYDGVIKYVNYATVEPSSGNIAGGNISATGNISGNYVLGNGSQLTGISTANTGNVTFSGETVIGTGTSNTQSGLYLAPDPVSLANNLYLRVRGNILDEPTHIHFDTGNNQYYNQFIGDDLKYIQLANTGNIVVNSNDAVGNSAQWTFETTGELTFPTGNLVITPDDAAFSNAAVIASVNNLITFSTGVNGGLSSLWVQDYANIGTSNIAAVYANPIPGSGNVRIASGTNGGAGPKLWDFQASGNTTFPNGAVFTGYDLYAAANSYIELAGDTGNTYIGVSNTVAFIQTDWGNTQYQWTFDANGNLSAPGAISAVGNITAGNIIANNLGNIASINLNGNASTVLYGNGVFAEVAGGSSYGNANVVANLAALGSNPVSTTGNITGGNILFGSGIVSGTGNITGGNLDLSYMGGAAKGNLTGGNISVTGNITGGNVLTGGLLSTGGNVTGGNILTAGAVSASSTITGANLSTGGTVSATGNVAGGNIVTGGLISATGNITSAGNILNQGFVSSTGNAIHGNILTGGLVSATGNITGGNLSVVGTINGSNINLGFNLSATGTVTGSNFNTTGLISAGGNVTVGNLLTAGVISATSTITSAANITGGNITTAGLISATGNITGGNISATNHTGTTVSITGNITAGNVINTGISSVTGNITAGNVLTGGVVSATGNITTANYFVGNLVGTTVSTTGNVYAGNVIINGQSTTYGVVTPAYMVVGLVTSVSGFGNGSTFILDTVISNTNSQTSYNASTGVFTLTAGVTYDMSFTPSFITFSNTTGGFFCYDWVDATSNVQLDTTGTGTGTSISSQDTTAQQDNGTARVIYTPNTNQTVKLRVTNASGTVTLRGGIGTQAIIKPLNPTIAVQATSFGNVSASGYVSATGNVTAANFFGNGSTLSNVATQVTGSWTVPTGNSTQSFTVTPNETYYMWVDCNIPNGILAWNATATVTNTNVPVVGAQYAWVYNGGGSPIDFTSIPNQFTGTANTIVRSSVAPSATTNRFDFGINNTSGNSQTVRYGWTAIS